MSLSDSQTFRVLLIEDDPEDVFLLQEMLEQGDRFELAAAESTLAGGLECLRTKSIDLILLDLWLPDSRGFNTFQTMHRSAQGIPIIILSGLDDEEMELQTMRFGAREYLIKGRIDRLMLRRAMRYAIEQAQVSADLARERKFFYTLFDSISDRIYFKDRDSRFIRINRALSDLFGIAQPEDAIGKTDADFFGAAHAQSALADEQTVLATGEPIANKLEFELIASGKAGWVLTTKLPLRDGAGNIVGTCGISREVSALKEMEEQLAAERNVLRSVVDNLPDFVFLKDREGRYLLDNAAHQRWLGAANEEAVLGRTAFDFYPEELARRFQQDDQAIIESGQPLVGREEVLFSKSEGEQWVLTSKIPWRAEDGSIHGLVCIARNITEQKLAREQLREAYADVARGREEVLAAMGKLQSAHEELRSVQLQLIEAEKLKSIGRLAAGVAHEVQNPLAILKLGVEFLSQQESSDPTVAAVLADMADGVSRADSVIRGLLDFSAPKNLNVRPVDLNEVLQRSVTLIRGELKGVEFIHEFERKIPHLDLDADKIEQVFINLLTNAAHAMNGSGCLTVRTYAKQLTGIGAHVGSQKSESFRVGATLVVVEIDDTGPGIAEEKLGKVFEPFFTTKPTGKGTGLGLSVVKTIIDLHGATIDLRNLPDGGLRVTLLFQARRPEAKPIDPL